jgi:hypothetical protein
MGGARWLVELDVYGHTVRLSSADAVTVDGERYGPGVEVGATGLTADKAGIDVVGWEPPGGWAVYVATVGPLEERPCRLYWHRDGQTLTEARTVINGVAVGVEHAGPGEPLSFTLQRRSGDEEMAPPPTAIISRADFSNAVNDALGQHYALIFGYPGSRGGGNTLPSIPLHVLSSGVGSTATLALALGEVNATTCTVSRVSGGNGTFANWSSAPITTDTASGRTISYVQNLPATAPSGFFVDDGRYLAAFDESDANSGGVVGYDGVVLRGAGSVARWLLETYTSQPIDRTRWDREQDWLDAYKVDTWIDEPIAPTEWISRALLRFLPARLRQGARGWWIQPQRYTATAAQVVRQLSADRGEVRRSSRIKQRDDLYTRFSISYRRGQSKYYAARTLQAQPGILAPTPGGYDVRELGRLDLALAELRFGVRPAPHIECAMTWDNSTASLILQDQADRHGWPKRAVQYVGGLDLDDLDPGQYVEITDTEVGMHGALALVEEVTVDVTEVVLDLTLLDTPGEGNGAPP